jgi:hypothetical protein
MDVDQRDIIGQWRRSFVWVVKRGAWVVTLFGETEIGVEGH